MPATNVCSELQALQRQRQWYIKSRNMVHNRLRATVAGTLGYHSGMSEKERGKMMVEADKVIKEVVKGGVHETMQALILTTWHAIDGFMEMQKAIEKSMLQLVKKLPVYDWVQHPDQKGFGERSLGIVVGECGDLSNYANPAKVWRRMGCAPWSFKEKTLMGATWRGGKEGKLPASEWEEFGYSPRRRSIAYLIGEGLVKQNGTGPYRARWLEAKVRAYTTTHPEWSWTTCDKCNNENPKKKRCLTCGGTGHKCGRAHSHGMLLATKLLLKNLWIEWNC